MFPLALPHLPESLLSQLREQSARGRTEAVLDGVRHWEQDAARTHGRYHPEALSWSLVRAAVLSDEGRFADALPIFLGVLRRARTAYGDTHPLAAAARAGLGFVYDAQSLAQESFEQFSQALQILSARPTNDPIGMRWLRLAVCDGAIEIRSFEAARSVLNQLLDEPGAAHTPELLLRLGIAQCGGGEGDEGEPLIAESIAHPGLDPRVRAVAYEMLAERELARNALDAALIHLRQALADRRTTGGLMDDAALRLLHRTALLAHRAGSLPESRTAYVELVGLLSGEHLEQWKRELCAHARAELGEILVQLGDYSQAEGTLALALDLFERGDHSALLGRVQHNLGLVLAAEGKSSEARIMLDRALATREAHSGEEHPEVAETLHALAVLRERMGDLPGARSAADRALAVRQLHFEEQSEEIAALHDLIERLPGAQPEPNQAASADEPAVHAATLPPEPKNDAPAPEPTTASGRPVSEAAPLFNKAMAMLSGAQHWEALQLLAEVLRIIEERQGSEHRDLVPVLAQMADAYGHMGFDAQARAYRERAERIQDDGASSLQ